MCLFAFGKLFCDFLIAIAIAAGTVNKSEQGSPLLKYHHLKWLCKLCENRVFGSHCHSNRFNSKIDLSTLTVPP